MSKPAIRIVIDAKAVKLLTEDAIGSDAVAHAKPSQVVCLWCTGDKNTKWKCCEGRLPSMSMVAHHHSTSHGDQWNHLTTIHTTLQLLGRTSPRTTSPSHSSQS